MISALRCMDWWRVGLGKRLARPRWRVWSLRHPSRAWAEYKRRVCPEQTAKVHLGATQESSTSSPAAPEVAANLFEALNGAWDGNCAMFSSQPALHTSHLHYHCRAIHAPSQYFSLPHILNLVPPPPASAKLKTPVHRPAPQSQGLCLVRPAGPIYPIPRPAPATAEGGPGLWIARQIGLSLRQRRIGRAEAHLLH
jgi:hypothetical protein